MKMVYLNYLGLNKDAQSCDLITFKSCDSCDIDHVIQTIEQKGQGGIVFGGFKNIPN